MIYQTVLETIHNNIHKYYEHYLPLESEILRRDCHEMKVLCEAVMRGDEEMAYKMAAEHAEVGIQYMTHEEED